MELSINIREDEEGVFTAVLKGRLDTLTYGEFEKQFKEITCKARALILDMAGIDYISSIGLSALFRVNLALEERKATLAMINMQPHIKQVFDTMHVLSPQIFVRTTSCSRSWPKPDWWGLGCLPRIAFWTRDAWRLWSDATLPLWVRQQGLLLLIALGAYFVNGMFHDVSVVPMANMTLFFLAGVTASLQRER